MKKRLLFVLTLALMVLASNLARAQTPTDENLNITKQELLDRFDPDDQFNSNNLRNIIHLMQNMVDGVQIASGNIQDDAILLSKINSLAIDYFLDLNNAIGTLDQTSVVGLVDSIQSLRADIGTGGAIADGSIVEVKIADNAVTNTKIADDAVRSEQIQNNTITDADLLNTYIKPADTTVLARKTQIDSLGNVVTDSVAALRGDIAAGGVSDGSITSAKLSTDAVTTEKITDLSITPEKLQESYASVINPVRYGAIGDGTSHPISEWLIGGLHDRGYANLTEIQVDYPDATALTDESDWMAIMRSIRIARAQRDATGRADLITLPRGNFPVNGTITLGHQIRLKGQNPNSTKIIAFAGCDTLIRMDEGKSFYEHNQLIEGIYLEGNDIAEYGVIAQNLNENGGLRDVWISRYRNTGFKSEGATYTTTGGPLNFFLENVHILGSEAVGVDSGPGIHFAPGTSDRVSITNCLINPRSSTVAGSESILIESGGSMLATISSTHVEGAEVGIRVIRGQANIMSVTGHSLVDTVVVFDQRGSNDGYGVAHVINNAGSANALAFYEDGREDVKSTLRAAYYAASNGLSIVSTAQSAKVLDVRG
ncbi:MAG: hypothetical protein ACFB15_23685, partial [Cyclobacteriaceae bacterium]